MSKKPKNQYSRESLYQDYKNHFVGLSRMTLTQFNQWYYEKWKIKKTNKNQKVKSKNN